ncbi:MAG: FtsX-like permease family protein [Oscillospiraceae bacterium]|nr:FtsX-like permease family protein [Oscillospiraceae bacterium]
MKLNKRYSRSIRSNLSFYVSATVLTVMTLFMFFMMNIAGKSIWEFGDNFFKTQNVEDASFTTYIPIPDEDIEKLEKEYSLTLEPQYYGNIETDGVTARVFKKTDEINLYSITVGKDIENNDEIIISEGYAVNNKISLGDEINVGNKAYTVTGFFLRPDYLYMLQNESDSYKNVTTFFLAYVSDDAFNVLGCDNCTYYVCYDKDNQTEFRKEINEKYYMQSYLSASENMRIDMVKMQAEMFIVMSYMILIIMPLIVVLLVSIVISRKVKSEQKMIGTLTALGYKKSRLMLHYAGFAMIPGLLGGIFAAVLSMIFAQPFGEIGLMDYEPMRIKCSLDPIAAILGIVIPTVMYVLAAMSSVNKLLKKDTVLLLNGNSDRSGKKRKGLLVKKKISFRIKYALRSLIGNPSRSFVVLLGIFLGSYIALVGYSLFDTIEYTQETMVDEMGSFEYQYVLNELTSENEYGGEPIIMSSMENKSGEHFSIIGTADSNPYLELKDINGNAVSLDDGYYITNVMAALQGVGEGEKFILCNPLTLEENEVTVEGIIDNDMQNAVFTSRKNAADLLGIDENVSNVIMSDTVLDIPGSKIIQTIKKSDAREQFQSMSDQMNVMIYFLIGVGAVICIASIYVAVNMLVTENRANISMLKVLGYKDRQINSIVLNVNHVLLPIGILISIPLVFAAAKSFMVWMAEFIGILPKAYIAPQSIVYTVILTCVSYFGSLFLLRRKVSKVDMVESLKDNRE